MTPRTGWPSLRYKDIMKQWPRNFENYLSALPNNSWSMPALRKNEDRMKSQLFNSYEVSGMALNFAARCHRTFDPTNRAWSGDAERARDPQSSGITKKA
ncbi:hypothetical protein PoB_006845800 [Plakobranchus ocellatus]|uniref:Uncharacterized protein n=1 Tax=Plakobranchus ocellatus TaxID=259542 RepID=A0AAV4DCI3_9GAST|nr:hypothetical protein PoB_006845800 [Plakobranchus ocellatus]